FLQMYKTANELEREGVPVLILVHLSMFTALCNKSLTQLKIKSISFDDGGVWIPSSKRDLTRPISKGTHMFHMFIPLPPKLLSRLQRYVNGKDLDGPLLFGLRGNPLANNGINYI